MNDLDDLLVLLGCQLGAPRHRKLGRTVQAGQTQTHLEQLEQAIINNPQASERELVDIASRRVTEEVEARRETQNYEIVIPIEEVQSINIFDLEIYDEFFAPEKGATRKKHEENDG